MVMMVGEQQGEGALDEHKCFAANKGPTMIQMTLADWDERKSFVFWFFLAEYYL